MTVVLMSLLAIGWVAAPSFGDAKNENLTRGRGGISLSDTKPQMTKNPYSAEKSEMLRNAQQRRLLNRATPDTGAGMTGVGQGSNDGGSCVGFCGGQSPDGCFCDEACCGFNDCCPDKFAVCGGCNPAGGAPVNDNCASATPIGEVNGLAFSTVGATTDGPIACLEFGYDQIGNDIWYLYTASCTDNVNISLCGSGYDTKIAVYNLPCNPGDNTHLACNDDTCGLQSVVNFAATAGSSYLIRIGGYQSATGSGVMTVACGAGTDPNSCVGFCGGQAPGGCFCDEACCDFLDCCPDKFAACGGCDPNAPPTCDPVGCPAGALLEGEPCGADTNGGCNSTPNVFTPIACGDTYCGVAWADGGTRDTDWYKLVLTSATSVTWSATAEFPLIVGIVNNNGVDSCAGVSSFLVFATADPNTPASVNATLSAGTWYLFIGNSGFSGNPCGACNAYVASVSFGGGGGCPDTNGDGTVGVADLLAVISNWGPCSCCPADVTGDGNIGVADLLAVISGWGDCQVVDPNSCVGNCGGQAPGGCFCDEACCGFTDCCADKFEACGGCDPGGGGNDSCVGFCGGQAPAGCFCDEACCDFLDCCADKFEACGGCNPGGPAVCDPVDCPAGALLEGEPCGADTNGGCNSTPNVFTPIACGDTYCGVAWADGGTRDTDWYKLVLTEVTTVTWSGTAEFPLILGVVNNGGIDSCAGVSSFLAFATGAQNTLVTVTTALNPGTWYLFVGNSGFSGNPCGACNAYTVNLACTPGGDPGDPNSCVNNCGGQAPGGCFCDEACCGFTDCCADKFAACGGCDPGGGGNDSCVGFCGGQAPAGCFCDEACCGFTDCCADKFAACGGCDPGGGGNDSCVGFCGGQAPAGCFCDEACCGFADCCPDKVAACGGCSP